MRLLLPGRVSCLLVAALLGGPVVAQAQTAALLELRGAVMVERGGFSFSPARGSELREADILVTQEQGEALVLLDDGARMAVRANSSTHLMALPARTAAQRRQTRVKLLKGGMRYLSGQQTLRSRVSFETQNATIGVRGTDIEIAVAADAGPSAPPGTYLKVNTGIATMAARDGAVVELAAGETGVGTEPDLTPRSLGVTRRPAARRLETMPADVFRPGTLDGLLR